MSEIYCDKIQNTHIVFLSKNAFPLIELVVPIDENSPVVKTLDKMGVAPYPICYATNDIEQSVISRCS
jgi:methylmalonyl-CoA/ethylmalonyl-CoA epimerase